MNSKLLSEIVKTDARQGNLKNLFEANFIARPDIPLSQYVVQKGEDMRIDLIFMSMYNLEPNLYEYHIHQFDVLLSINEIDNPLNILEGTVMLFPPLERLDEYRVTEDIFKSKNNNLTNRRLIPNVGRKLDPKRKNYINSGYSFPPTILKEPKDPVTIQNGKFFVGGIQ